MHLSSHRSHRRRSELKVRPPDPKLQHDKAASQPSYLRGADCLSMARQPRASGSSMAHHGRAIAPDPQEGLEHLTPRGELLCRQTSWVEVLESLLRVWSNCASMARRPRAPGSRPAGHTRAILVRTSVRSQFIISISLNRRRFSSWCTK
eukprot:4710462-Pyramimonas_sp.AAC.1